MTIDNILENLSGVRRSGRGWMAKCPAHADHAPSLSVREAENGRILLYCFGGCAITDICRALSVEMTQLFGDSDLTPSQRRTMPPQPRRFDRRKMSHDLEFASESHWLRAKFIFKAARQINLDTLNDQELDEAWQCLGIAFHTLRVSDNLAITAFQIRCNGLDGERPVEA